jgi:hypothetical protein
VPEGKPYRPEIVMKRYRDLMTFVALCSLEVAASEPPTQGLVAFYPLRTNAEDRLGNNPPFVLTNTPFGKGAVYVNGSYEANGHFVNYLATPPLRGLRLDSFTVSLDFCPEPLRLQRKSLTRPEWLLDELTRGGYAKWIGYSSLDQRNILTGGQMYRWIGFNRDGGLLHLTLNNQRTVHRFNGAAVTANRWHHLVCSLDLQKRQIITFFDGRALETVHLPDGFTLEVLGASEAAHRDREFGFVNYSIGSVYRGYAANLKIFAGALTADEITRLPPAFFAGLPTFHTDRAISADAVIFGLVIVCLALVLIVRNKAKHSYATSQTTDE